MNGNGIDASEQSDQSVVGAAELEHHQQFLGDAASAMPQFARIEISDVDPLPTNITLENIYTYENLYIDHCEVTLAWFYV